ncbi:MAG: hypothetical protein WC455_12070, partial [Dehalococcoidia bacterium]
ADRITYHQSGRTIGYQMGWTDCCFKFNLTLPDSIVSDGSSYNDGRLVAYYHKPIEQPPKVKPWQPPKDLHDLIGERMETVDGCAVLVCGADNKSQMVYFTKPCGGYETGGIKAKYLRPTTGGR